MLTGQKLDLSVGSFFLYSGTMSGSSSDYGNLLFRTALLMQSIK